MEDKEKKLINPLRALASELEKRGQMKGIVNELVNTLIKNVKDIK